MAVEKSHILRNTSWKRIPQQVNFKEFASTV